MALFAPFELSRREALAASLLLTGCIPKPPSKGGPALSVADAHLHLFNASDLPAGGFINYVYLPSKFETLPGWAAAAVDLFATFFKRFAVTVEAEAGSWQALTPARLDTDPDAFGTAVTSQVEGRTGPAPLAEGRGDLARSYRELTAAVAADAGIPPGRNLDDETIRRAFRILAEKASRDEGVRPGDVADGMGEALIGRQLLGLGSAARLIAWGYLMLQSRGRHLDRYVARFGDPPAQPRLLLTHLVDYDKWLNDGPLPASDHLRQARFMADLGGRYAGRVDLRTFAGFCPLKHAIELKTGQRPTTLESLQALRREGKIAGFKIYPPMGFLPIGNATLRDDQFDPRAPGRRTALDLWRQVSADRLGPALDASLHLFYRYCVDERVPLMAHASWGNEAGRGFGQRANPVHWERVVAAYSLRLSLGHLVHHAGDFVKAVDDGPPYAPSIWALHGSLCLLRADSAAPVFGDLGYMPELIDDERLSAAFFVALRKVFERGDPHLSRILYGTDWIMLGLERHDSRFLAAVRRGMEAARYTTTQKDNILYNNARAFLGLP